MIVRLSELPTEQRLYVEDVITKMNLPKPSVEFDSYGLRFPIEHLNKMNETILFLPLEYISKYVDGITKKLVDSDNYELFQSIHSTVPSLDDFKHGVGCTSFGNLAYVAMYAKDTILAESALSVLNEYNELINDKHRSVIEPQMDIAHTGYGGIDDKGDIVDRRIYPSVEPLKENLDIGIPAPKDLTD